MVFRLLRIGSEQICQPCFACLLLAEISETILCMLSTRISCDKKMSPSLEAIGSRINLFVVLDVFFGGDSTVGITIKPTILCDIVW